MRNPFKAQTHVEAPTVKRPPATSFFEKVWSSPVDFNRAARRSVGLWGSIWRWKPTPDMGAGGRYLRRHYVEEQFAHPKTRRQRRHKARILRILAKGT